MQTTSNGTKVRLTIVRGLLLVTVGVALARWSAGVAVATARLVASGAPVRPDEVLAALAAGAAALCLLWLAVVVGFGLAALVPGTVGDAAHAACAALTPRVMRRTVGLLLGVGVVAGLAPSAPVAAAPARWSAVLPAAGPPPDPRFGAVPDPAWAAPEPRAADAATTQRGSDAVVAHPGSDAGVAQPRPSEAASPTTEAPRRPTSEVPRRPAAAPPGTAGPAQATVVPDPRWVPPAPTVRPQPDVRVLSPTPRASSTGQATREAGEVVVRRGDTLWSIAARHLGPEPSDAEIAQAWPAWHEANRGVVGPDPDLLLPGQVLRTPGAVGS